MFIRDLICFNLYHPESDGNDSGPLTASSIEDALNSADDEGDVDDSKADDKADDLKLDADESDEGSEDDEESDDESVDEDDESSEDEDDEKDKKKTDLDNEDDIELAKIPKRAEIKEAYPDIFKKFPALDHIIQREHAYAEVFPAIADAKNAKAQVEDFKQFQDELLSGELGGVLTSVKKANPKAFAKITDGLLDTLMKVDGNSHLGITARVTKGILNHIHTAASAKLKRDVNDKQAQQLQIASELIHEAIFQTNEVTPFAENKTADDSPELTKLKTERAEFDRSRFQVAFNTVSSGVNNTLTRAVERDIDTKNLLPPYAKKNVVKEVMAELDRQLSNDVRFKGVVQRLWERAKENNFNDESQKHIKTALIEKAKTIIQPIMRAKKGEAIKGLSVRSDKSRESSGNKREESRNTGEKRTSQKPTRSRSENDRMVPKDGESAYDFLSRD